jgi:hypothetical protein
VPKIPRSSVLAAGPVSTSAPIFAASSHLVPSPDPLDPPPYRDS